MMSIPHSTLKEIAALGGGFILDVSKMPHSTIKEIAANASIGHGYVILKNVGFIPHATLKEISALGKGHVIFDLTT